MCPPSHNMRSVTSLTVAVALLSTACATLLPASVQERAAESVVKPKIFIISMFGPEAEQWYGIPEFDVLAMNITVPGFSPLYPDAHCTADGDICQLTTGEAEINAATTIASLVRYPGFDLTTTYFMVAGIAGVNPEVATICSVTFARYAVQVALQYEFSQFEIPTNFTNGYIPLGSTANDEYPQSIYGTEVFEVNQDLQKMAATFARKATLNDSDDAIAYRANYAATSAYTAGAQAPSVIECDVATSDVYYSGSILGQAFGNYTSLVTNGSGVYCTTAQEDNATLEAMLRAAVTKVVDFSRIIIMRTASDFDRPWTGEAATTNLWWSEQGAFEPSLVNIYLAGREVIGGIMDGWNSTFADGVNATNYIGDIFGTLGGTPNFGPYTYNNNPVKRSVAAKKRNVPVKIRRVVTPLTEPQLASRLAQLSARALPANAPHGYVPQTNSCPSSKPTVRSADSLSSNEQEWLPTRRNATLDPLKTLLGRMNITGLDTTSYINSHSSNASALPNIGIAMSGGGYRAMLNGAGILEAFDDRTPNATSAGQLGGLLQSATYLSGLSGGSWLVGSLYTNNFTSINDILAQDTPASSSGNLWQLDQTIFEGPSTGSIQLLDSVGYYTDLQNSVSDKGNAGFNTSITDYWGRALSYQLVNASNGGPAFTWSSIANQDWFTSGSVPFPILVADSREPGEVIVATNTTVYDFNPFEFGSWDPTVFGFVPMQYVGTNFSGGTTTSDVCVTGFDNVGFVMGTSSTLFNAILTTVNGTNTTGLFASALQNGIESILGKVGKADDDIADYPNPFYQYHTGTNPYAVSERLTLVDGGEDNQNIPLHPLIQPLRHVDVIFAVDSSADTNNTYPGTGSATGWPDGASLVATYQRSMNVSLENGTSFPSIPGQNTFVNLGLNNRPTFFGCDAKNMTGPAPIIVYLPNAPYVYNSNVSTFDLQYNDTERNAIVLNGYNGATQGNGTLDPEWATCVGCAILSRSLDRTGTDVPAACTTCFNRYCWNGEVNNTTPGDYVPKMKLTELKISSSGAGRLGGSLVAVGISAVAGLLLLL
ncbi:hypothetical protein LTR62_003457 [Meristemomyces frigidus]|uniref:Lysophospholipase n=1 Tax=Meristemomyces frigidus TaxID=1508187 RepID=A0AAN7TG57_9PEZI|nr:hypothetical protein LTR62_003457 [Meristemomyces frigidus]